MEDYSLAKLDSEYCFIGKTDEEKSLVCVTSEVLSNVIRRMKAMKGDTKTRNTKKTIVRMLIATLIGGVIVKYCVSCVRLKNENM